MKRKIIYIDEEKCNGCGLCVLACAENAIKIINGKAKLISDAYCDGLGACLPHCPTGALSIIEREAEEFNEELAKGMKNSTSESSTPPQCPSVQIKQTEIPSTVSHWPIQIRLISPSAPFLTNSNLLVCADCVPPVYKNFHKELLSQNVLMLGCPKFDPREEYVEKFAQILLQNDIQSITVVVMEVPCCQALPLIVLAGMKKTNKNIPIKKTVISIQGNIIKTENIK